MPSPRWPDPWVTAAALAPVLLSLATLLTLVGPEREALIQAPQAAELDRRLA